MNYELKDIRLSFGSLTVLDSLDMSFPSASVSALLGPSGCGKTSILKVMAGLLKPDSGSRAGFESVRVSYCFQEPRLLPWLSVRENILFALSGLGDRAEAESRADRFIAEAGLSAFSSSRPQALSGGMKQRVNLARAFAYPSEILLLDEAFASADLGLRIGLLDLFGNLWEEEKRTAIMVTHDVQDALYAADRVIILSGRPAKPRRIIEIPREEKRIYGSPVSAVSRIVYESVYGEGLKPPDWEPEVSRP